MDIDRIRYFCTVAKTGSLVKASQLLRISQPALSKSIKVLELELGKKVFVPSGRGIALTDYGKKLVEKSIPLLEAFEGLKNLENMDPLQKTLSVATFEVFSTYFFGKTIQEEFSDLNIKIFELTPGKMEEALIKREADIGITYIPIPHPELDFLKCATLTMGIFGIKKKWNQKSFQEVPFAVPITSIESSPTKIKGLDGWPDHELPRKIQFRVEMLETALDLCRRGLSVGYFPEFVVRLHNEKVREPFQLENLFSSHLPRLIKQDVFLIKRKSDVESVFIKKINKMLRLTLK